MANPIQLKMDENDRALLEGIGIMIHKARAVIFDLQCKYAKESNTQPDRIILHDDGTITKL
jgi:hypothetical protein